MLTKKQTFIVTLEVPYPFGHYFPMVEAERMAGLIRDGIEAKSASFLGPAPFDIRVERADDAATASGQMKDYSGEESAEAEHIPAEPAKIQEAIQGKCLP